MQERIKKASLLITKNEFIRIISHYDADGLCSAGIICNALKRSGKKFHLTCLTDLTNEFIKNLSKDENSLIIFSDIGSSNIDEIENLNSKIIIIDHHKLPRDSEKIVLINSELFGINGSFEICSSTIAYLLANELSKENEDLVGVALSGIIGDKQHYNLRGINKEVIEEGMKNGYIKKERDLILSGKTVKDALLILTEPFIKGISGREEEISKFLSLLKIDEGEELRELSKEKKKKLSSLISLKLLKQEVKAEYIQRLTTEKYFLKRENIDAEDFSALINACGRLGQYGLGIFLCFNNENARENAWKLRYEYKKGILEGLIKLENRINEKEFIQFFYSEKHYHAGALAGIGMNYLFNQEKPTIALTKQDNQTKVSSRGSEHLIAKGLDLAIALKLSAEKVGGNGGGHAIASGATIPKGKEEEFLEELNRIVGGQLKR